MPKIKSGKEQLKEALKKKEPEVDETGYYVRRKEPEPKRIYAGTDRGFITQEEVKPSKTRYSVSSPTGGREVSYEEYKNEVEAAKIIAEGGRKSITPEEMAAQREQQIKGAELAGQIGEREFVQPELFKPDIEQAATAGIAKAVPSLIGGAIGGAVTGATVGALGGPIGAAGGAILGGLGGAAVALYTGITGNIKDQRKGEMTASVESLTQARTNLMKLVRLANSDPRNADKYADAFNDQLTNVAVQYSQLQVDSQQWDLASQEDGTEKLAKFEEFYAPGGTRDVYSYSMQSALRNPDPSKNLLTEEDFATE